MFIKKTSEKFYLFKNHNPAKVNYIDRYSGVFLILIKNEAYTRFRQRNESDISWIKIFKSTTKSLLIK